METFVSPFLTRENEKIQYHTEKDTYFIERPYSKGTLTSLISLKTDKHKEGIPARLLVATVIDYLQRLQEKDGLDEDLDNAIGNLEDALILMDRRKDICL